ncbi:MAG: hypothetical protein WBA97_28770 [Actinophytocola sp.]|uniref:hypothetical protein n=1 Tax=Actinophytocola sp. TaxID=1872138 RepID=UPI003C7460F5
MLDHSTGDEKNLADRRDQLARLLRLDTQFSEIIATWAGFGMQGEQTAPARSVQVEEDQAPLLGVPVATSVVRRDVHLVSRVAGPEFLAAAVTEFVYEPRLGLRLDQRRAVRAGSAPLEHVVNQLRRNVCYITTPATQQGPDDVALRATTLLLRAGTPVAVVTEVVYWRLITHRMDHAASTTAVSRPPHSRSAW